MGATDKYDYDGDVNNNNNTENDSLTLLKDVSSQWTDALTEVAQNLQFAASALQDEWNEDNENNTFTTAAAQRASLPDPVKLLRRIHGLEKSVQTLQHDFDAMSQRRQQAVGAARQQLVALQQLCRDCTTVRK